MVVVSGLNLKYNIYIRVECGGAPGFKIVGCLKS